MKFRLWVITLFSYVSFQCNPTPPKASENDIIQEAIIADISDRIAVSGEQAEIAKFVIHKITRIGHNQILPRIIKLHETNERDVAAILVDAFKRARANPALSSELIAWESGKLKDEELTSLQLQKLAGLKKLHETWLNRVKVKQRLKTVADTAKKYFEVRTWVVFQKNTGELEEYYPTFFLTDNYKVINFIDSVPQLQLEKFE